jgi:selenocysteine-specific elongation factor
MMENHFTLGVAGHIDHGKTSLTKKLTNVDTDRLKEEKERNISIELGFAPLVLPSGKQVGVVDVPGHEKFIRQMIAGAAGIDLVLLVVASDEGIMPQTREHMDIIRFLGIERGIIVLTKKDLVEEEWLEMVVEEIREWAEDTFLAGAPVIPVSSHTGEGIGELLEEIDRNLETIPVRDHSEPFRMPIDRVFTKKGAGAVVTGTVYEGSVSEEDMIEVFPLGEKVKVRQLHVHHQQVNTAYAGQRTAINLGGIDFKELERGHYLTAVDYFHQTDRLDVKFTMLPQLDFKLKQRTRVRLHMATSEVMGKLIFYDRNECDPGDEVLCQIQLEESIIAKAGDPFVFRRLSPAVTIGGGQVLSPYGVRRKFGESSIKLLELLKGADHGSMLRYVLADSGFIGMEEADHQLALGKDRLEALVDEYERVGTVKRFGEFIVDMSSLQEWTNEVKTTLMKYHQDYSMRMGMKKSELRSKKFPQIPDKLWREFIQWLRSSNTIEETDETVRLRSHQPAIPSSFRAKAEQLLRSIKQEGLAVTEWSAAIKKHGIPLSEANEVKAYFVEQNQLVSISPELMVELAVYNQAIKDLQKKTEHENSFTTPQVKEILGLSRKYLIPFLESLDEQGITKRIENERTWLKKDVTINHST